MSRAAVGQAPFIAALSDRDQVVHLGGSSVAAKQM